MRQYAYMQDDGSYKMFRRADKPCVRLVNCSTLKPYVGSSLCLTGVVITGFEWINSGGIFITYFG